MDKSRVMIFIFQIVFTIIGSMLGIMLIDSYYPVREMEKDLIKIEEQILDTNPCNNISESINKNGGFELMNRALNKTLANIKDPTTATLLSSDFPNLSKKIGNILLEETLITNPEIANHCNHQTTNLFECVVIFYKELDIENQSKFKYQKYLDNIILLSKCLSSELYKEWLDKTKKMYDAYGRKYNLKNKYQISF